MALHCRTSIRMDTWMHTALLGYFYVDAFNKATSFQLRIHAMAWEERLELRLFRVNGKQARIIPTSIHLKWTCCTLNKKTGSMKST
jgi:hypothetical protein